MAGNFIWYELFTSDVEAAQKFYGHVVGWTTMDSGQADKDYRIWMANDGAVGGLMALPSDAALYGMKSCWLGYIHVPDVDRAVAAITTAGGSVHWGAADIPNVGRLARVSDPQGAQFYVMAPLGEGESAAFAEGVPGHCSWNELQARDGDAALKFYSEQFGWRNTRSVDMGPSGVYHVFSAEAEGDTGGIATIGPDGPSPAWTYYFCVDDIDAAKDRVIESGGSIVAGPHAVPGGGWIIQAIDPQDCKFALVGNRSEP